MHVNKGQLITELRKFGVTKKAAKLSVDAIFGSEALGPGIIATTIAGGERVDLLGFGSFSKFERSARKGRNPQSNTEVDIPKMDVPKFKAGARLKQAVR